MTILARRGPRLAGLFFFGTVACLAALACAGDPPRVDPPGPPRLLAAGPLLGYAGHDAVVVWAWPVTATSSLEVAYALAAADGAAEKRVALPAVETATARVATSVRLEGLAPGATYRYRVIVDGRADEVTSGTFRVAPPPGSPVRTTFATVSCMNARRYPSQVAWTRLLAAHPDLLLQLGDQTYANSTDPAVIRAWYLAQRRVPEYAAALRAVPTLGIWDDHDFGANDTDGTLPGKDRSLEAFKDLWPNPDFGLPGVPGVFHRASYGDLDIWMLDDRWYRSPDKAPDDEGKEFLGEDQFRWLERGLRASKATFKLVACGSTIKAGSKDSWEVYTHDRERLVAITKTVPGVIFLTGDIHRSAVQRFDPGAAGGYPIVEVISSGIAVNMLTHYFVTMSIDTTIADPTITARVHRVDPSGREQAVEEHVIKRSELVPAF